MLYFISNLPFAIAYSFLKLHAPSDHCQSCQSKKGLMWKSWLLQVFMPSSIVVRKSPQATPSLSSDFTQALLLNWLAFNLEVGRVVCLSEKRLKISCEA